MPYMLTVSEWYEMGAEILPGSEPVGTASNGEPLYSEEQVNYNNESGAYSDGYGVYWYEEFEDIG